MGIRFSPIFCDHCCSLALAELDEELLCFRCLLMKVEASRDPIIITRIRPMTVSDAAAVFFEENNFDEIRSVEIGLEYVLNPNSQPQALKA